jgi:hypothetical protein
MPYTVHVDPELGMELGSCDTGFKVMVVNCTDKNSCCTARKFSVVEANIQK